MKIYLSILFMFCFLSLSSNEINFVKFSEDPWPPFTYGEEFATEGIAVEFTDIIFKKLGINYEIKLYPWKRCLIQMKQGIRDGVILSGINEERKEYMEFTDPIMYDRDLIWYRTDRIKPIMWSDFSDLKDYKITTTLGFSYGQEFDTAVEKYGIAVNRGNSDLINFKLLAKGREDIFICNETVALWVFDENPELSGIFKYAAKPLKEVTLHMAFSKKSKASNLVPQINEIIKEIRRDGTIDSILGR